MNGSAPLSHEALARLRSLYQLPPAAREEALNNLKQQDAELGQRLADWLADSSLEATCVSDAPRLESELISHAGSEPVERQVGAWQLEAVIGRGGMGEVWRARRSEGGFEQWAAVKLLKRGMDSDAVLARFLQERRILARLEHPSIARLLDGGLTAAGRPYFAMELVDGLPIDEYVRQRGLRLRDTLELFLRICAGVEFAHRNLVVHRDLKPGNILVDRSGAPKLLDFGIAKLLHADEELAVMTVAGSQAMTPAFAAPEQLSGEPITTATDVFALGLILYQLLTGELPASRRHDNMEALRLEAGQDITLRPSQVLRTYEQREVAAETPRILARELRGDADAIVLTALRCDPGRRYASPSAMAEDIRRLLGGHPVTARPDSLTYRLGRFIRRHRAAMAAASLALIALCASLVLALWQAQVAQRALGQLEGEFRRAEQEAARAESSKTFLVELFQSANPGGVQGDATLTVRDLLLSADSRLDQGLGDQPLALAELRTAIAISLRGYGEVQAGSELIVKALQELDSIAGESESARAILAAALHAQGSLLVDKDELDAAETALLRAGTVLGTLTDSASTRQSRRALNTSLALLYNRTGRSNEALDLRREDLEARAAELAPDHPELATSWYNLAISNLQGERFGEALHGLRQAERIMQPLGELASPRRVYLWASLALVLASLGDDLKAQDYLSRLRALLDAQLSDRAELYVILHRTEVAVALLANRFDDARGALASWLSSSAGQSITDPALQQLPHLTLLLVGNEFEVAEAMAESAALDSSRRRGADDHVSTHMRAAAAYAAWMFRGESAQLERLIDAVQQLEQAPTRRHYGQAAAWLASALTVSQPEQARHWSAQAQLALGQAYGEAHPWTRSMAGMRRP